MVQLVAMTHTKNTLQHLVDNVESHADKITHSPTGGTFIKWGHAIRGWLYITIGVLTVGAGLGLSTRSPAQVEALTLVGKVPGSTVLLVLIAAGLAGYSLWGWIRAIKADSLIKKMGYVLSALSYTALLWPTFVLLLFNPAFHESSHWKWVVPLILNPLGRWLVLMVGIVMEAAAAVQMKWGWAATTATRLKYDKKEVPDFLEKWFIRLGRWGYMARAVLIGVGGIYVIRAAWMSDPVLAWGLEGAVWYVANMRYGHLLVDIMGIGLVLFGVYSVTLVKWLKWPPLKRTH